MYPSLDTKSRALRMNFSNKLIDQYKEFIKAKSDAAVAAELPHMTRMNLSEIRKGGRKLTEEQAIHIAEACELECALVLVELAAECAKTEKAQSAWNSLAKKLKAASSLLLLAAFLSISGTSGLNQSQRIKYSP